MNEYEGLLESAANKYHILRGTEESEVNWKSRVIYSICGLMAYASLWDDEGNVSIVHLKIRVRRILKDYKALFPDFADSLPMTTEDPLTVERNSRLNTLEDEIYDQFLDAGIVYHQRYHVIPSMKHEEILDHVCFQRGIGIDNISCVSGLGFYSIQERLPSSPDKAECIKNVKDMFGLPQDNLKTVWENTLSSAAWKWAPLMYFTPEYLRLGQPFRNGYWINTPHRDGRISILRSKTMEPQSYHLYRYTSKGLEVSPLPEWQVESHNYRALSCALLASSGKLPSIRYSIDGSLVHVHLEYLLPPRELNFLRLYSWPETCRVLPNNFNRILTKDVFDAIRNVLTDEGYHFREE